MQVVLVILAPEYLKNRPNSWTHGFAIGYFYPNGFFDVQLIRIIQGKIRFLRIKYMMEINKYEEKKRK